MRLAQVQSALFSLVTQDGRTWLQPEALVAGGTLNASERVQIYAEMYRLRTRDSLREDFPHLAKVLGDDWDAVVDAYVDRYHSEHHSLHRLGRKFSEFLGEGSEDTPPHPVPRTTLSRWERDLAGLEWARAEAFVAVDSKVIGPEAFQALGERLPAARLELVPSLQTLELEYDVDAVWRAMEAGGEAPAVHRRATRLVVWRKGFEVFHSAIEADELEALTRARAGQSVAEICEAFAGREDPARAAFAALGSWVNEGMIARAAD